MIYYCHGILSIQCGACDEVCAYRIYHSGQNGDRYYDDEDAAAFPPAALARSPAIESIKSKLTFSGTDDIS